jgi:hypothetical protein
MIMGHTEVDILDYQEKQDEIISNIALWGSS